MDTEEQARTIRLPRSIWAALDKEASSNNRTSVKQLATIMAAYFDRYIAPNVREDDLEQAKDTARTVRSMGETTPGEPASQKKRAKG